MTKALVTGGLGFIGSNLVNLLEAKGYSISLLDNLSFGYLSNLNPSPSVSFIKGDVRDNNVVTKVMQDVDVVFHLAASVGNIRSVENPLIDSEVNVLGTLNVLEAARKYDVRKVVYSSSAAIFGEVQYLPIDEAHPCVPNSPYGVSKLAGEKHCLCYSYLYGMDIICLRYFNVYGINQRFDAYGNVIPIFATRMLRGEPLTIYGDGEQTRDFVNVADSAQVNLLAAGANGVSGVFNIGSGKAISINQLASMIQEVNERQAEVQYAPARKGEVRHSHANISAAQRVLGYKPRVTLIEGLREYVEWMRLDPELKGR